MNRPFSRRPAAGGAGGSGGGGDDGDVNSEANNDNYTPTDLEAKLRRSLMRIINTFNIRDHEGGEHGGHTLEKHIAKLIEWLENRAKTETVNGATSFTDEKAANILILDVLVTRYKDIENWMRDPNGRTFEHFDRRFSESTGYGFTRKGEQYFDTIQGVRVVLKRTSRFTFKIYTAYPTDENFGNFGKWT